MAVSQDSVFHPEEGLTEEHSKLPQHRGPRNALLTLSTGERAKSGCVTVLMAVEEGGQRRSN